MLGLCVTRNEYILILIYRPVRREYEYCVHAYECRLGIEFPVLRMSMSMSTSLKGR